MNIFFTGAIRGGRAHQPEYARIVAMLEKCGTVYSRHVQDETLSQYGETDISAEEILKRERNTLEKCKIVVAEVTTPSLGVGYLIACATSAAKKVVALYRGEDTLKLSAIIKGDRGVAVYTYDTDEDLERIFEEALEGR